MWGYGTPEEFAALLQATYSVIRQENPDAKIIVTLDFEAGGRNQEFAEQVLLLGGDYFDIASFHPYSANPYIQEDAFNAAIIQEQKLLAKYGNKWDLTISEIGQPASEVSEEEQTRLAEMCTAPLKLDSF